MIDIKQRQSLSLDEKIKLSKERIIEWYEFGDGKVSISFSGGKDSTVLLNLVRSIYPEIPAIFVNTGLEYPEIKTFVKTIDNVIWLRPKIPFHKVIDKYGYPVVSKIQARFISDVQKATEKNRATVNLRLTGINRKGEYCPSMKISKKWLRLINSGFKISDKCCDIIKKEPFHKYQKKNKRLPIIGTMAHESNRRLRDYLKTGCNSFKSKTNPISMPIAFWLENDIWNYLKKYNVPYSKIYDMGERRTGCMFCMFGVHLEKEPNRFQRMKYTHPKYYKYCMEKLGLNKILDYIGVNYI